MKRPHGSINNSRNKKIACTVSAAALMLGVSSAATIGLHFQDNYCGAPAYSGYPVTMTAFGIAPSGWENLLEMNTGYSSCPLTAPPYGYSLNEVIDTTTSTNGLNPLPNGSLNLTWWGPTANFCPFAGYACSPPHYDTSGGPYTIAKAPAGEAQIYATFLRDGINWGPRGNDASGPDNDQPGYWVDITGLKSLFTNSPFVIELVASSDSMETLTNAFIYEITGSTTNSTNSVSYPATPPVANVGDAPWVRGAGGGLSTGSGALNTDHIFITSAQPAHFAAEFNRAGTISGFILTDKPVVSMYPQMIPVAGPGDSILLSAYAIGVPPLSCQWRLNGTGISGATNLSYAIGNVDLASGGNYDLVVTNAYGAATSQVSIVTVDRITPGPAAANFLYDSNPTNPQHNGMDLGASWQATSSDGTLTRTGVMAFVAANTNGISVPDNGTFDTNTTATVTFWMRSAGVNTSLGGTNAAVFCRPGGSAANDLLLAQTDGSPGFLPAGHLYFQSSGAINTFTSSDGVSDNKWHFVALTFDNSDFGTVTLYIDGALDTLMPNPSGWSWPTGKPLEFGYSSDPGWRAYDGLLADVRYYTTELSASQVATIYSSGALVDSGDLQMQLDFTAAPGAGIVLLNWKEGSAVLQSATSPKGPWTNVPQAVSPYAIVPAAPELYFRYSYTPQSLASNPYLM
jgi:hypothetical protein